MFLIFILGAKNIEVIFLKNNNGIKRFSIRKYAVGAVSIITGVTIFIGGQQAQAAETSVYNADAHSEVQQTTQQVKVDKPEEALNTLKQDAKGSTDSQQAQSIDESKANRNNQHSTVESAELQKAETTNQPKLEEANTVKQDAQPSKNENQQNLASQSNKNNEQDEKVERQTQTSPNHNQQIDLKDKDTDKGEQSLVDLQKPSNDRTYQTQSKSQPKKDTTNNQTQSTHAKNEKNVDFV